MREKREKRDRKDKFRKRDFERDGFFKKLKCRYCADSQLKLDHLDIYILRKLTTERGKILPSRITGCCAKHQRHLAMVVKRARQAGLLPYINE